MGSEPVVIAAWVVEESTWSKEKAPAIKNLRERFISWPLIQMAHTARKRAIMDLVVGRDNRRIFPELSQEACLMGDDFFICNILFSPGQVIYGAAQESIQWVKNLEDPEEAKKPQFRYLGKGKKKAKGKERPAEVVIARRVSMTSSAGQSPHHGLQDDIYEAEGGSSCRGETPIPSDLGVDFPEPEVQRLQKVTGDPDFCQHRDVLRLPESGEPAAAEGDEDFGEGQEVVALPEAGKPAPESDADLLAYAMDRSLQVAEQRLIYFVQEEVPELRLEEAFNDWEVDSNDGCEAVGEARGPSGPAQTAGMEQEMEEYLRVATPDIPTLFPRPACDLSCRPDVSAGDTARRLEEYGAECLRLEQTEAEYRAHREQAKVWRRERNEDLRRVLEARARQDLVWHGDLARRVDRTLERSEEERRAEEQRMKEVEREQLEEQKRNEEKQQLEERRRKAEEKKKEDKKGREVEKQKLEEEKRRKRRKEVDAATALAKKKKEELAQRRELKARVAADEYNLFLVREAEREQMLAEEAKAQLVKKSEEADRAREAKAEKDWQELQEKESAEGVPVGSPAFRYRSIQADRSREMLESVGNLRDRWNEASLEKGHWFDSDLCILEPINSMQMAVFEQLKVTGLLCSRFSATVKKGRRFFPLAGEDAELPNGKGSKKKVASQQQQRAASPAASAPDGGSRVEGSVADELLAVPGSSGVDVRAREATPPVPAVDSAAAAEPAGEPAAELAGETAAEPTAERSPVPAVEQVAAAEPARKELSVLAAEFAAVVPAAESAAVEGLVSKALSVLALEPAAVEEPAAGPLGELAKEPAAVSAVEPMAAGKGRPVLANGPVAATKECWVINPGIPPKVIVKRIREGSAAAAEAATPWELQAGEPLPGLGPIPAAGRAAA